MAGLTFLRVVSNAELDKQDEEAAAQALQERQNQPMVLGLSQHIRMCWDVAKIAKKPIEDEMLRALRQRNGQYEPDKLQQIKAQGGSEIYMMITEVKCRAAESWLRDILLDSGTPPWDIVPTPIPDLSPNDRREIQDIFASEVLTMLQENQKAPTKEEMAQIKEMVSQDYRFKILQDAQNRADKMKLKIEDQFAQGGWSDSFNDFITDLVTFPAAFIKGPIVRRQRTLGWKTVMGKTVVEPTERLAPEFERVDPFRIYPEPGITRIEEGYLFEHHPLSRSDLSDLIGVPGYDEDAIRRILDEGAGPSWINEDVELIKNEEERKFYSYMRPTDVFDALEFWGKVSGKMLREWGLTEEEIPDEAQEYDANVWMIGNYVIKAVLNYDPLGQKPYCKTSFIKCPGAFWGKGIPEIIEDIQNVCNAAARALVNNMGIASGPQVEVNLERIPPNEDITQMSPWKIWQVTNDPVGSSAPAVRFTQPEDNANTLVAVYDKFARLADDHSGIPAYLYGNTDVQGAGRTSSGLSMLMGAAGKGIRQVVGHIDGDVIKPIVQRQFVYNMRYDEDESIKGDVQVVARGAVNLAVKETVNVRRIEFLNATANEIDMSIMGRDGRAAILREVAKGLQMPVDELIPSRDKLAYQTRMAAAAEQAQAQQAAQQQPAGAALQPDGAPKGGMESNTVMNRSGGQP
jgi:flagellar biosynthesis regulator FlbT